MTQETSVVSRYDHRTFTDTVVVGYHRTNTAIAVFYSVHGGLSGHCFLKTAHHLHSVIWSLRDIWSLHGQIRRSVGDTACPPTHVHFPTHSRDSPGTVLSETIAKVSLSAPPPSADRSWSCDIHLLPTNNPSLDADQYSPAPRWHVKKHRHRPS